jgi:hypothetical protein
MLLLLPLLLLQYHSSSCRHVMSTHLALVILECLLG